MTEIIKQFDIFLRYYLCGAIFIITILFSIDLYPDITSLKISAYLFVPIIPGAFIYAIHRNLINVVIEAIRRNILKRAKWKLSEGELTGLKKRWDAENNQENTLIHIKKWGDHVQLLYSSALAIFLAGLLTPWFDTSSAKYTWSWHLTFVFIVLAVTAFFSDIRKQIVEDELLK